MYATFENLLQQVMSHFLDFDVTEQEMADCQAFAQSMEQVIMNMLMDGLITI